MINNIATVLQVRHLAEPQPESWCSHHIPPRCFMAQHAQKQSSATAAGKNVRTLDVNRVMHASGRAVGMPSQVQDF